jgi:hypothetical protein
MRGTVSWTGLERAVGQEAASTGHVLAVQQSVLNGRLTLRAKQRLNRSWTLWSLAPRFWASCHPQGTWTVQENLLIGVVWCERSTSGCPLLGDDQDITVLGHSGTRHRVCPVTNRAVHESHRGDTGIVGSHLVCIWLSLFDFILSFCSKVLYRGVKYSIVSLNWTVVY